MALPPVIDGRDADDLFEQARHRARTYAPRWDPATDEVGTAMLYLFAALGEEVVERLDRVPEKHRIAFYDRLGFDRAPPQAARLPLSFRLADDAGENLLIPAGTRTVAPAASDRPEATFELVPESAFEATPAAVRNVYSVDPVTDRIFDHWTALSAATSTTLFDGTDLQSHVLSLAHEDLLSLQPETTFQVAIETDAAVETIRDCLVWEYYGEGLGGEDDVGWHPLRGRDVSSRPPDRDTDRAVVVTLDLPGATATTTVADVESRWLRCRRNRNCPSSELFGVEFGTVYFEIGPLFDPTTDVGIRPDALLTNDVPLDPAPNFGRPIRPFGKLPRDQDTFYLASEEAFTKAGTIVSLVFESRSERSPAGAPVLSWEYWDGEGWARLRLVEDGTNRLREDGEVRFRVPDDFAETSVSGHEGHWVRVRLVGGDYGQVTYTEGSSPTRWEADTSDVVEPYIGRLRIEYGQRARPEHLVPSNNLSTGPDVAGREFDGYRPFVGLPDERQTLYVGFDGPLYDGPITVFVSTTELEYDESFFPRLRWEYCADAERDEWVRLSVRDGTESLTRSGIVRLTFPDESAACERFGVTRHWIRARVTGDPFDRAASVAVPEGPHLPVVVDDIDARRELVGLRNVGSREIDLSGYQLDFEFGQPAEQVRALPNGTTLEPGRLLTVATGTKSLGTADLSLGYDRWVLNNTELDQVSVRTPGGYVLTSRQDVADGAGSALTGRLRGEGSTDDTEADSECTHPDPCGTTLETTAPAGEPVRTPPTLTHLVPNTGWAENVRTVADEILGSSEGEPDQSFTVASPPVADIEVWIDELSALSEGARQELRETRPADVERVTTPDGDVSAFRVRWERVDDWLESGADDRHYTVDQVTGEVTFGDGVAGRIPPRGRDNVEASYRTGGGPGGNVDSEAVTDLKSPLPLVDSVRNPVAADGGVGEESTAQVVGRAPAELRHRGKAVCAVDYERLAMAASRLIARSRCLPGLDPTGRYTPGWVTVLVVPQSAASRPTPSVELKRRVRDALSSRAPVTLVGHDESRLVVRGPSYVSVAVRARLVATEDATSISTLEETATDAVAAFLHPLTGGPAGDGWAFGELPCLSDLYGLLEDVTDVDHVASLSMTFTGSGAPVTVTEGEDPPSVAQDALVYSATHDIEAHGDD